MKKLNRTGGECMENSTMPINWYPGHMAKTKRILTDQIKKTDLVLELCDARLPHSSRNPVIRQLAAGKKTVVLLNKADLADINETEKWLRKIRLDGAAAYAIDSKRLKTKDLIQIIQQSTREAVEKAQARGIRKTVKVMVLGVPNVGKSTLINALRGKGIAQTGDRPGVTKSNQWIRISPYLELMDTPGMLWPRLDDQKAAKRLCYIGSVKDDIADIYMLAVSLLEELKSCCPEAVMSRFHLDNTDPEGQDLMDAVCKGRGWLLKGGEYDYDRAARVVLDEFRGGKLGRITLESADSEKGEET
jgi:ribosome biogenesis GTPase A